MVETTFHGLSDMGRVRTNNEDTFFVSTVCDDKHILAIVVDGVGGYEGGEVAAAMARDTVTEYFKDLSALRGNLRDAVVEANNKIYQARKETAMYSQMSCVLTAVLIDLEARSIEMAHVGDTRLYQLYDGKLQKLSHDHSLVGYREEIGELTEQEAMRHPNRNLISKVVGTEFITPDSDYVEHAAFPLIPGSTLLLCSDGLYDMVTTEIVANVLGADESIEEKAKKLILCANEAGGQDNVTVVLMQFSGGGNEKNIVATGVMPGDTKPEKEILSGKKRGSMLKKCCILFALFVLLCCIIIAGVIMINPEILNLIHS